MKAMYKVMVKVKYDCGNRVVSKIKLSPAKTHRCKMEDEGTEDHNKYFNSLRNKQACNLSRQGSIISILLIIY